MRWRSAILLAAAALAACAAPTSPSPSVTVDPRSPPWIVTDTPSRAPAPSWADWTRSPPATDPWPLDECQVRGSQLLHGAGSSFGGIRPTGLATSEQGPALLLGLRQDF